ncbi:Thionin [Thalictrum thalictroides]|uniref:Thionin n=1 Tax=Thalictrum thalictroides TaxID=46969 RepID=A0A7J6WVM4_THATH|nr:Thionin [Thalictrum thalictroides]
MEGKGVRAPFTAVIMCLLILGLVVAQTEAIVLKSCCRNTIGRKCYNACRLLGQAITVCGNRCDCTHIAAGAACPTSHPSSDMLENSGAMINEYCKLGCASSVCDAITSTNENSDVREGEVKEAVDLCNNACSEFCNKGAKTALASA